MQGYNLIAVFDKSVEKILMCKRIKEPYLGLYNFVGGKIEENEDSVTAAYRELFEETGIDKEDISPLVHLCDFNYPLDPCYVETYVGVLKSDVKLLQLENPLFWLGLDDDFFSMKKYAGEGNIGHIMEHIKINSRLIFGNERKW